MYKEFEQNQDFIDCKLIVANGSDNKKFTKAFLKWMNGEAITIDDVESAAELEYIINACNDFGYYISEGILCTQYGFTIVHGVKQYTDINEYKKDLIEFQISGKKKYEARYNNKMFTKENTVTNNKEEFKEKTYQRLLKIEQVVSQLAEKKRKSFNTEPFIDALMERLNPKLEYLQQIYAVEEFSEKRKRVMEVWLDEIEILLGIDE